MKCDPKDHVKLFTSIILTGEGAHTHILRKQLEEELTKILTTFASQGAPSHADVLSPADSGVACWFGLNTIAQRTNSEQPGPMV